MRTLRLCLPESPAVILTGPNDGASAEPQELENGFCLYNGLKKPDEEINLVFHDGVVNSEIEHFQYRI